MNQRDLRSRGFCLIDRVKVLLVEFVEQQRIVIV